MSAAALVVRIAEVRWLQLMPSRTVSTAGIAIPIDQARKLGDCAPFTVICELERFVTSKHRRLSLTVAPMPDWQPSSQLIAKPVNEEDLAFLCDLL